MARRCLGWIGFRRRRQPRRGRALDGADFDDAVARAITSVSERLRQAETVSVAAMKGEASLQKVVEEVMAAEQSLQTAIAVRDKVVAAYLEISRMQI
jgi:flagellar hook-basal body complex protein FliE